MQRTPRHPLVRLSWLLWAAILLVICARVLLSDPRTHSVYLNFAEASRNWIQGQELYRHYDPVSRQWVVSDHRYGPLVALLLVPFSLLADPPGGVLWRLLNAAAFFGGLLWWLRAALPCKLSDREFGLFLLMLLPTSLDSLNNGQSNPLTLGLLLAACAAAATGRWNSSGILAALAALFKVYPLALGLLLALLNPRKFPLRFLLALAAGASLPFLFQDPGYVWSQYVSWIDLLRSDDRTLWPLEAANRDLWLLLRVYHVPLTRDAYLGIQLLSAAAVAAACLALQRAARPSREVLTEALAMGCCWMTLMGPASEAATYILLAPILAWTVLEVRAGAYSRWWQAVALVSLGMFVAALLAGLFPNTAHFHARGVHPLGALLLWAVRWRIAWPHLFCPKPIAAPDLSA